MCTLLCVLGLRAVPVGCFFTGFLPGPIVVTGALKFPTITTVLPTSVFRSVNIRFTSFCADVGGIYNCYVLLVLSLEIALGLKKSLLPDINRVPHDFF